VGIALLGEIAWIASRNGYGWQIVISRQLQEQKRFDRDQREWQQPPPHHSLRGPNLGSRAALHHRLLCLEAIQAAINKSPNHHHCRRQDVNFKGSRPSRVT